MLQGAQKVQREWIQESNKIQVIPGPAGAWCCTGFIITLPSLFLSSDPPTPPPARTFTGSAAGATTFSFLTSYTTDSPAEQSHQKET